MKDYLDQWYEEDEVLWMQTGSTKSIGFITTEEGWGIDKKYLAKKYQWRLIRELEKLVPDMVSKDKLTKVAYKVERRVLKDFKKSLKGFKLLDRTGRHKGDKLWDKLTVDHFKYILEGELFDRVYRIEEIIDNHYRKQRSIPVRPENFISELINSIANMDGDQGGIAYDD